MSSRSIARAASRAMRASRDALAPRPVSISASSRRVDDDAESARRALCTTAARERARARARARRRASALARRRRARRRDRSTSRESRFGTTARGTRRRTNNTSRRPSSKPPPTTTTRRAAGTMERCWSTTLKSGGGTSAFRDEKKSTEDDGCETDARSFVSVPRDVVNSRARCTHSRLI